MHEDTAVTVPISGLIPANTVEGSYKVYLNLPDTSSTLRARKEYSVRLANVNVWEDATGYNLLNHTVFISQKVSVANPPQAAPARGLESFTIAKQNGSVEFSYSAGASAPCTFAVFTLAGTRVWGRTVRTGSTGTGKVSWTGGAPGVYLLKVVFGDERSAGRGPLEICSRMFTIQS